MTKTVAERLRETKGAKLSCRGDALAFAVGRELNCPQDYDCKTCAAGLMDELADAIEAERAHAVSKALSGAEPQLPAGVIWPRFEDGELVNFGDEFLNNRDNTATVTRIALSEKHFTINKGQGRICKTYGNRIKRPEPEVLDADGVPIKVGDMVYHGHHVPLEVTKVCADGVWLNLINGKAEVRVDPHTLTHRKPDTLESIFSEMVSAIESEGCVDLAPYVERYRKLKGGE